MFEQKLRPCLYKRTVFCHNLYVILKDAWCSWVGPKNFLTGANLNLNITWKNATPMSDCVAYFAAVYGKVSHGFKSNGLLGRGRRVSKNIYD